MTNMPPTHSTCMRNMDDMWDCLGVSWGSVRASWNYREADKISWGRPGPKPIKVVGPFVFYAFAPGERKNQHDNLIFYWPHVLLASASP